MTGLDDHLLRTFAAVPQASRVLDLGCGDGRHTVALARLGFDLFACDEQRGAVAAVREQLAPLLGTEEAARRFTQAHLDALGYPDDFFDWAVAVAPFLASHDRGRLVDTLRELRRVLKPGAWVYVAASEAPDTLNSRQASQGFAGDSEMTFTFTPTTLVALMEEAGFVEAQAPHTIHEGEDRFLSAIFRHVDPGTPI